jgi:hypothetical protein
MPLLCLVLLFCILRLDVIELLALELVLVLGLLGGAGDAGREEPEDVGGVRQGREVGAHSCNARENVLVVEMHAPVRELAVIGGDQESCLCDLALVGADAPKGKEVDVGGDVALVKILLSRVRTDVLLLSCPCGNNQRKGGEGVQCEDCIAKEGSRDEAQERLEVDEAAAVGGGWGGLRGRRPWGSPRCP